MPSSSSNIGYAKLIEMDMETDSNLQPGAFKSYTLPLKQQEWIRKRQDLEKAEII